MSSRHPIFARIAAWAAVLAVSGAEFPGSSIDLTSNYAVDVWKRENGLPQNSVISIVQSRDGYLWLGTLNGAARFDGTKFVVLDESNTPELDSSKVSKVFEDSQRRLWLATETGGIFEIAPGGQVVRIEISRGSSAAKLMAIAEDVAGAVWLYTADGQLARYDSGKVDVWDAQFGAFSNVRSLAADRSGLVWVGSDQRLVAYGPMPVKGVSIPAVFEASVKKLDLLLASKAGGVWRLANGQIERWSGDRVEARLGPYPWRENVIVSAACEDSEGNLVVGTYGDPGDGLWWVDRNGVAAQAKGLSHSSILSVISDRDGSLWVGTAGGGLNRIRPQQFAALKPSQGFNVQSVAADGSDRLWIAYNGNRIDLWSSNQFEQFTIGPVQDLRSVLIDKKQTVWAGTLGSGLFRLEGKEFVPDREFMDVANPRISAIFQDSKGALWVGTRGGAAVLDKGRWRTFSTLHGLSANAVQAIAEDTEGAIWLGTEGGGLNRLRDGKVSVFTKGQGLPGNNVTALCCDKEGATWVGTSSGLARFKNNSWHAFTTRDGLSGNSISYLLIDRDRVLWIGSNGGLMRLPARNVEEYVGEHATSLAVRSFGLSDGMPSGECSQGSQPSAVQTSDGRLWFATIAGLAFIDPSQVWLNTNPPPVLIESISVDGKVPTNGPATTAASSLTLQPHNETLEIHFVVLNLSAPDKARYRYRMGNHESAWTEGLGNRGVSRYTKLPPGEYSFQVVAANEDGVWNNIGARLQLTVLPPFWRTTWFLALSIVSGLALIVGIVYFISTQKLQRQLSRLRQQEALERERARIARDLHDQLGANLTQVALLGELAESDKESPADVESHARQISQTARDTTRALDEIVWTVNPANDTLDGLINYICKYAQEYLAMAGLRYRIEVPPELPALPISPEVRHNTFLSAKEAINNIVKHANAKSAWLRLELTAQQFTLEITDDGRGVSAADREKSRNGLKNMESRMRELGGRFTVEPGTTSGTVVRLTAPIKAAREQSAISAER